MGNTTNKPHGMMDRESSFTAAENWKKPRKRSIRQRVWDLESARLFFGMTANAKAHILSRFRDREYKAGKNIMIQGEPTNASSELHIITKGQVRLIAGGSEPLDMTIDEGTMFGETALLFAVARTATAMSLGAHTCSLTLADLRPFLPEMPFARMLMFMRLQPILRGLSDYHLGRLAEQVTVQDFSPGQKLIERGTPGHEMFLIRKGQVQVSVDGRELAIVGRGDVLGQRALHGRPRTATCAAMDPVVTIVIPDAVLDTIADPMLERILACDAVVAIQQHSNVFQDLTQEQIDIMLQCLEISSHAEQQVIRPNDTDHLYVVRDGKVDRAHEAGGFQYFVDGPAVVTSPSACVVRCPLRRPAQAKHAPSSLPVSAIRWKGVLGTGESATVRLGHIGNSPGQLVAIKVMSKSSRAFLSGQALAEALLMQSLDHPFCVRLLSVTEDAKDFYLVMEYMAGGELFHYLNLQRMFTEEATKFYIASVCLALDYLHSKSIIYRDLKPENLLLDGRGYAKLADFGYSKRLLHGRTFTMCGTPEYQAPEVMTSNSGATTAADYWSLGVLTYELLTGVSPFVSVNPKPTEKLSDPWVVIRNAKTGRYPPPRGFHGTAAHDFIDCLLQIDPSKRLHDLTGVKGHVWLQNFDWQRLMEGHLPAPHIPGKGWSR